MTHILHDVNQKTCCATARHFHDQKAAQSWTPGRPHRSHCPSPPQPPAAKCETVPPSHRGVMRRARVIIKLETGLNREEILTADNLCVSISGQRERLVRMRPGLTMR